MTKDMEIKNVLLKDLKNSNQIKQQVTNLTFLAVIAYFCMYMSQNVQLINESSELKHQLEDAKQVSTDFVKQ